MLASELVRALNKAITDHGDWPVVHAPPRGRNEDVRAVEHQTHDDPDYPEYHHTFYLW